MLPAPLYESDWKSFVAILDDEHRLLRAAIASFAPERLHQLPAGGKVSFVSQIYGIALHDVYHAGQIQLLKRMRTTPDDRVLEPDA